MTRLALPSLLITLVFGHVVAAQPDERGQRRQRDRFERVFSLPGVEFDEAQREKVDALREEYTPKLTDLRQRRSRVETDEQRRARREAFRTAREAGKKGRELRQAVADAVPLTEEQRKTLDELRTEQRDLQAEIRGKLRELLTAEQRAKQRANRPQRNERNRRDRGRRVAPTHANVKYGPHRRNVMDVWLAESDEPTPVLVSIHGGGFRGGNKGVAPALLRDCLDAGISVVAITYRLSQDAIAPAQFHDSARAIQFVRHSAKEWNLDPKRIASTGGSAGAGLSLWLALHDDLADPDADDPIARQSTRLTCASVYNGQTSYDPRFIRELFPGTDTYRHPALAQLYDVDLAKLDELPEEKYRLFEETAPITHVSKDDVPVMLCYASELDTPIRNQGIGIHHPRFGKVLDEKMQDLGIECRVHTNTDRNEWARLTIDFVKERFGLAK